jgi:hypothetical protein
MLLESVKKWFTRRISAGIVSVKDLVATGDF